MGFLNKKKVSGGIVYYITEVLIVIAGIFIAIQLDNWNEKVKTNEDSVNALSRILTDLRTEKYVLTNLKQQFEGARKKLVNVTYNNHRENLDSIVFLFGTFIHYKMNSEYINLKYSGKLNLIKNDKLRYDLVNFYEVYYTLYGEIAEGHKKFINDRVLTYLTDQFPSDTTNLVPPKMVEQQLGKQEFRNLLIDQIAALDMITKSIQTQPMDSLIKYVGVELKSLKGEE